ncbi:unnamed protein product [Meloidogyne enterolobii]|uniref:Uncharacterized protein n=1 Tax=Meloidogyne enterolobii TaxID=390850 RepID=A0ACB0ZL51_MELEN
MINVASSASILSTIDGILYKFVETLFFLTSGIITIILYFPSIYFFSLSFIYNSSNVPIILASEIFVPDDEAMAFPLCFNFISSFFGFC